MTYIRLAIVSFVLAIGCPVCAQASLIGDDIDYSLAFTDGPQAITSGTVTVIDPGVEVSYTDFGFSSNLSFDFTADTLTILVDLGDFSSIGSDIQWSFSDLDWIPGPGAITNIVQTGGPTAVSIGFTADSIDIVTPDFGQPPQAYTYTFDIITNHGGVIPEPTSLMIFGSIAGIGLMVRRRNS